MYHLFGKKRCFWREKMDLRNLWHQDGMTFGPMPHTRCLISTPPPTTLALAAFQAYTKAGFKGGRQKVQPGVTALMRRVKKGQGDGPVRCREGGVSWRVPGGARSFSLAI